jgi:hypothetical protein
VGCLRERLEPALDQNCPRRAHPVELDDNRFARNVPEVLLDDFLAVVRIV